LPLPPSLVRSEHPASCAACSFSVPCLLFFFFFFFCGTWVSLSRELCWFIPGVAVGIPHAAYLLTCWSASPKLVWSRHLVAQEPSCFLRVTWCGDALHRLGVCVVRVLLFLGVFVFFFSAKGGSSISARFLIYGAHAVCLLPLVTILDPPQHLTFKERKT
jgi:hypothetical protein